MKQKLFKAMLLLCALVAGSTSVWGDEVTFDYSDYKGNGTSSSGSEYTMVKTDVSIKNTKFYGNTSYAHFYASGVTTITPASGVTITGIVLTASATNYNGYQSSGTITASTGSVSGSTSSTTVTWAGSATSAFTISNNKQIRWTSIVVTYTKSGSGSSAVDLTDAVFAWSDASCDASIGGSNTFPTLTNTQSLDVEYQSTDGTVATIAANGTITLLNEGTTTIKAIFAGNASYNAKTVSYTLTVTDPSLLTIWSEDFSSYASNAVPSGGTYSYVCTNGSGTSKIYAENSAGGTSPELLVGKSSGTFSATIPLLYPTYGYSGDLTLTFKSNTSINVKTTTDGITVDGETEGAGLTFSTKDTHTVKFKGVTTATPNITIVFTATSSSNVRLDDIVLKGKKAELTIVATPSISPASGAVVSGTEVTMTCATDGATIYYTTNGDTPTSSSTLYNPLSKPTITANTTIKAIGIKGGLTDSDVASATYTIAEPCATPTFSPAGGEVDKGTPVTINCGTAGATIYYTTDGNTPTTSSSVYSSALTINSAQTIKAIAVKDGNANSEVASATYTVRDYATLPFNWAGGTSSDLTALTGVTASGLGSDYAVGNAPYRVKMDGVGDYIQIKTNAQPGKVYVDVKMLGGASTSKIKVQESADGSSFTDVEEFTISGSQNTELNFATTNIFNSATRYVKIIKSVHGSNIGVGPIKITQCESVSITDAGYATFASTNALDFTGTGIDAYIAITKGDGTGVTFTPVTKVPANTGILLYKDGGTASPVNVPAFNGTGADDVDGNKFVKGTDAAVVSTDGTNYNYVLYNGGSGLGFYKANNKVVASNKAYISVQEAPGFVKEFIALPGMEDDADGLERVQDVQEVQGAIYNLAGQRLNKMQKGINIVNGKKILY